MNLNEFSSAITSLWHRIDTLQRRVYASNPPPLPLMLELLEELSTTLEELRIVEEELYQQTEELAVSREAAATEHARYRELFEFAPDGYVMTDAQGTIVEANREAAMFLQCRQEHLIGTPLVVFIALDDRQAFRSQLAWLLEREGVREWEIRVQPLGKPHFPAVLSCTVSRDGQGRVMSLRWLLHDISALKEAEEAVRQANQALERQVEERALALRTLNEQLREDIAQRAAVEGRLRASLNEKEVLLKEVHHRVKNNMQIVSSLLSLQASQIDDLSTRKLFQESHHRIQTMALVHDTIYASGDLAHIDLAAFSTKLASYLTDMYGLGDRIALNMQTDDVLASPDTAIPYGLILNELVSNCLKHAFPEGRRGLVQVMLRHTPPSHVTLTIQDDGLGFPPEINFQNPKSLGLQLAHALSGQLGGTPTLDRDGHTTISLTFLTS